MSNLDTTDESYECYCQNNALPISCSDMHLKQNEGFKNQRQLDDIYGVCTKWLVVPNERAHLKQLEEGCHNEKQLVAFDTIEGGWKFHFCTICRYITHATNDETTAIIVNLHNSNVYRRKQFFRQVY